MGPANLAGDLAQSQYNVYYIIISHVYYCYSRQRPCEQPPIQAIAISPNRTSPPRLASMMVRLFKIPISCDGSLTLKIHKSNCHLKQSLLLQQRIFDGLIFEDLIKRNQLEY